MPEIIVQIKLRWWLKPYLSALVFFCHLWGTEPDWEKLDPIIKRGLKVVR